MMLQQSRHTIALGLVRGRQHRLARTNRATERVLQREKALRAEILADIDHQVNEGQFVTDPKTLLRVYQVPEFKGRPGRKIFVQEGSSAALSAIRSLLFSEACAAAGIAP